ncbi:MAG: hypothetical protein JWM21_4608 [Acidobacteria bacterium]|nr:hypothetical protein [Acidobacteriota bacterium]
MRSFFAAVIGSLTFFLLSTAVLAQGVPKIPDAAHVLTTSVLSGSRANAEAELVNLKN